MEAYLASLPVWANLVLFSVSIFIITKGADWFTGGAVGVAQITGIPKVVVGATLVSLGTTAPEFSVSAIAAYWGHPATSVGNALGSTICNIGLILAVASLIAPVSLSRGDILPKGAFMLTLGVLMILLAWDAQLGRAEGLVLLVLVFFYLGFIYLWGKKRAKWSNLENAENTPMTPQAYRVGLRFITGAISVVFGSILLVQNAAHFARAMGIPELVIGLTLVALGTSLPELVTAIAASWRGHGDIAVGNVMGANVLNLAWVLGGASMITPLHFQRQSFVLDFPFMLMMMALFLFLALWQCGVGRREGFALLSVYVCYLGLMFAYFV